MLQLLLQFLMRLFFHRPAGTMQGQRSGDLSPLFLEMEGNAKRLLKGRYVPLPHDGCLPLSAPPSRTSGLEDNFYFGL